MKSPPFWRKQEEAAVDPTALVFRLFGEVDYLLISSESSITPNLFAGRTAA